jgi:hypothetical protein
LYDTSGFGVKKDGVSIRINLDRDDIVLHKGLLSFVNDSYIEESEYIIRSWDRDFDIQDVIWQNTKTFKK